MILKGQYSYSKYNGTKCEMSTNLLKVKKKTTKKTPSFIAKVLLTGCFFLITDDGYYCCDDNKCCYTEVTMVYVTSTTPPQYIRWHHRLNFVQCKLHFFFCSRVLANRRFYLCPDLVLFESNVQMVSFTRQLNYSEPPAPISRCQLLSAASTKCPGQSAPMYTTTGRNNVKLSTEHLWMRFFK